MNDTNNQPESTTQQQIAAAKASGFLGSLWAGVKSALPAFAAGAVVGGGAVYVATRKTKASTPAQLDGAMPVAEATVSM